MNIKNKKLLFTHKKVKKNKTAREKDEQVIAMNTTMLGNLIIQLSKDMDLF